jgi:hypothetical protein
MILFAAGTRKLIGTGIFIFCVIFSFAQTKPDSIPTGVITVKRALIPAAYSVSLIYLYPDSGRGHRRITEFSAKEIVFTDTVYNPYAPHPKNDFLFVKRQGGGGDSAIATEGNRNFTDQSFDWKKYLSTMNYFYTWTDSTRSDSAQYLFVIDKKGNATCKQIPWAIADSSCRAFEKKSSRYAQQLNRWYPAQRNKKIGSLKMKKVPCNVYVVFYAFDPNEGRLMPIENVVH